MTHRSRRIGPYTLIRTLGRGGMGTVYLARDAGSATVALKVLHPELAAREDFRRRFDREAEAARRVARFCTAPVLDAGFDGDTAYLVTEYVDGPDLSSVIDARGPMTGANLEALAVGVATALVAIHQAGVVHLDLKPSNILLSAVGPRVIDFGIARLADAGATQSATVSGTPAYMAPEQANGLPTTPASDVFAWGGVIACAGTGRPPFGTGAMPEVLYRVVHHVPALDGLDERLRPLVEQALHKDPARRPTAQELLDRLMGRPSATVDAAGQMVSDSWTPPQGAGPRRRLLAPVAAVVLAVAVTLAGVLAFSRLRTPPPPVTTRTITSPAEISFTHTNTRSEKARARVRIDALRRQGADVQLEWTIINDAAGERITLYHFHTTRYLGDSNASSVELIARGKSLRWQPTTRKGRCACTSWESGDTIAAGESMRFFAVFSGVPEDVTRVDVDFRNPGVVRNVLITAK